MASRKAKRYQLILYTRVMKRWLSATLWIGIFLVGSGAVAWFWFPEITEDQIYTLWGLGAFSFLVTLILFLLRKGSYVQPYKDYLKIVTPFMRVKVPYKTIKRTHTADMISLFPVKKVKGMRREILEPFFRKTAIVISLTVFPRSPQLMYAFMSPFFFTDKSPHFVLLVNDWLELSTELESYRAGNIQYKPPQQQSPFLMPTGASSKPKAAPAKPRQTSSGLLSSLDDEHKK